MAFEQIYLISVKNVDLETGLSVLNSISNKFSIREFRIKRKGLRGCSGT